MTWAVLWRAWGTVWAPGGGTSPAKASWSWKSRRHEKVTKCLSFSNLLRKISARVPTERIVCRSRKFGSSVFASVVLFCFPKSNNLLCWLCEEGNFWSSLWPQPHFISENALKEELDECLGRAPTSFWGTWVLGSCVCSPLAGRRRARGSFPPSHTCLCSRWHTGYALHWEDMLFSGDSFDLACNLARLVVLATEELRGSLEDSPSYFPSATSPFSSTG